MAHCIKAVRMSCNTVRLCRFARQLNRSRHGKFLTPSFNDSKMSHTKFTKQLKRLTNLMFQPETLLIPSTPDGDHSNSMFFQQCPVFLPPTTGPLHTPNPNNDIGFSCFRSTSGHFLADNEIRREMKLYPAGRPGFEAVVS